MTRARDLGIPFEGAPGRMNSITDVDGVEVGHTTVIADIQTSGDNRTSIRTGITAILPRGKKYDPVFAAWYSLNGCGEMTGTTWIEESGFLESGIALTSTSSIGVAHDILVKWARETLHFKPNMLHDVFWFLPVVAETADVFLNDISENHLQKEHIYAAFEQASPGPVPEGNVGGGTGMVCFDFKGGIGTASRRISIRDRCFKVGILVQTNFGDRNQLMIAGAPVGKELTDLMPEIRWDTPPSNGSSIIVVVATDAPLLPHQLKRIARRVPLGIAKTGGIGSNVSGDIFLAFSTANPGAALQDETPQISFLPNAAISPLFEATIQATEEAIINALIAAESMLGIHNNQVYAIPHNRLIEVLRKYNRI